jgi:hypothetical protein
VGVQVVRFIAMLSILLVFSISFSQEGGKDSKGVASQPKERRATLNFEDELVEGSTQKPELFYLFQKKIFNYGRLIKLRKNFIPEMRRTSEDLQRSRGTN